MCDSGCVVLSVKVTGWPSPYESVYVVGGGVPSLEVPALKFTVSGATPVVWSAVSCALGGVPVVVPEVTLIVRETAAEAPHAFVAVSVAWYVAAALYVCDWGCVLLLQVRSGVASPSCRRRLVIGELPSAEAVASKPTPSGA